MEDVKNCQKPTKYGQLMFCEAVKVDIAISKETLFGNTIQLIQSWGRRSMAMAGDFTRHGQAHPYSWLVTIISLKV